MGSSFLLPALVLLTAVLFWAVGSRLEAVWVGGLSTVSPLLNLLLKVLISRPRPTANLVHIIQAAVGYSFPSGHVMAYIMGCFAALFFRINMYIHHSVLSIVSTVEAVHAFPNVVARHVPVWR